MTENACGIHLGDRVKIATWTNPARHSEGSIYKIVSSDDLPVVILKNGDKGRVIHIINSENAIKERIMSEDQYTENKENFGEDVMCSNVIPHTVQSFLNSEGGYLYIGVKDTGGLKERLVGLDYDFDLIRGSENIANDKLCDVMGRRIMSSLGRYLESEANLGPLVQIKFVHVCGVQITEIKIGKSPKPWFYRHISKSNKPQQFELHFNNKVIGQRILDDFYIREGGGKKLLQTHNEFYTYAKDHFINYRPSVVGSWQ